MTIAFVQHARGYVTGASNQDVIVNLASAPIAGNVLIATAGAGDGANPVISGISQTNVAWSLVASDGDNGGGNNSCEIWIGIVSANAGTQITVSYSVGSGNGAAQIVNVCEFSGIDTANPVDKIAKSGSSSGSTITTGLTDTTTQNDELLVGSLSAADCLPPVGTMYFDTPTNGFTMLDGAGLHAENYILTTEANAFNYKIVSLTGQAQTGVTAEAVGGGCYWYAIIVTFKASAGPIIKTVTDSISLSDSILTNKTLNISDRLGLADGIMGNKTLPIADSLSLTDLIHTNKTLTISDAVTLTDQILRNKNNVTITDVITLTDVIDVLKGVIIKTVTDTLTLTDTVYANKTLTIQEALALADQILANKTLKIQDALSLADAVKTNKTLTVTDALSLIDSILTNKNLKILDTLTLADAITVLGAAVFFILTVQNIDRISLETEVFNRINLQVSEFQRINITVEPD
jgi:hypothetical protein